MFDSFAGNSRFDFFGAWFDRVTGRDKWLETEANVTGSEWRWNSEGSGDGDFLVSYTYQVAGEYYFGRFASLRPWDKGESLSVRYNPRNPKRKYLASFNSGREALLFSGIAFGCLVYWFVFHLLSQ